MEFLNREGFKRFADDLYSHIYSYPNVCITGYFSETIRESLTKYLAIKEHKLKLICQEFDLKSKRDQKNLDVLRKLCTAGAEIRVNNRLHARFLLAYDVFPNALEGYPKYIGLLVIGSFDFNTECIGKERFDAGIKTRHPDLVRSALELFTQIWNEPESSPLDKEYPEKHTGM